MKDPFQAHNERVRRSNPQSEPLPEAPDEIQALIDAYNAAEQEQYERLGAIYAYCMKNRKRAVNFVGAGGIGGPISPMMPSAPILGWIGMLARSLFTSNP